ncbi:hypothetical protein SAMN05444144_10166 [Flavobacterium akiainvivens]|nr:hypothetical protein SAMN05444144_10166 [Flavobacterium akiainvivens]
MWLRYKTVKIKARLLTCKKQKSPSWIGGAFDAFTKVFLSEQAEQQEQQCQLEQQYQLEQQCQLELQELQFEQQCQQQQCQQNQQLHHLSYKKLER